VLAQQPGREAECTAWLERGVTFEDTGCMRRLADRLAHGPGRATHMPRVRELLERAVALADAGSTAQLGRAIEEGWFGPPDPDDARVRYRSAAERGSSYGMFLLGRSLLEGNGGPRDPIAGLGWLEKSAAGDEAEAVAYLARIGKR
jgi:hypothetical protein